MTLTYFHARNSWGFTTLFSQNMGFEPEKHALRGFHAQHEECGLNFKLVTSVEKFEIIVKASNFLYA